MVEVLLVIDLRGAVAAMGRFGFLLDNAIRNRLIVVGQAAREYAVELFMLPKAPPEQPAVPGRVTQRSGDLAGSVRAMQPQVSGNLAGGSAVYQTGLEAGGAGIPYAAIQELGGSIPAHDIFPLQAQVLAWQGPDGVVFARSVHFPGATLPPRPYMAPGLQRAAQELPAAIEHDVADIVEHLFAA